MSNNIQQNAGSNAIYGLGLIGAAIYYISAATSFIGGVIGFLKALVWPVFLVYEAFKALN
ncbi:MAG TPA: hypothetical protein DDX98_08130 [Bacteroidales bacterium]|jgi:hypothetical protein|nr:hypothetical protein [Bacteroidales bacterium]